MEQNSEDKVPNCPKCGGAMWDNRVGKRNPKAPDFKCRDKSCDGVIWPPRDANMSAAPAQAAGTPDNPACPVCGGPMWDDRASKRNPRAPDFKCRNKPKVMNGPGCPGVIWPPRDGERRQAPSNPATAAPARSAATSRQAAQAPSMPPAPPPDDNDFPGDFDDDLPF